MPTPRCTLACLLWTALAACSSATLTDTATSDTSPPTKPSATTGSDTGVPPLVPSGAWQWVNPTPFGSVLWQVDFADSTVAYAAGSGLSVLRSDDGGATWQVLPGIQEGLSDWHPPTNLNQLVVTTAAEVWVVGDRGLVAHTIDGGATWADRSIDTSSHLRDIHWFGEGHVVVVGDRGALHETTDGGLSWDPLPHPAGTTDLNVVGFASPTAGWIGGDDGTMLSTIDGKTWSDASPGLRGDILSGQALSNGQMLATTSLGGVSVGSDRGFGSIFTADEIRDADFVDPDNGVVLYVDKGVQSVGVRTAGDWTHGPITLDDTALGVSRHGDRIAVVGWRGSTLVSHDAGLTWDSSFDHVPDPDWHQTQLFDVCFDGAGTGLAVGSAGAIYRTTDHGITWSKQESGSDQDFWACWITDGGVGFAVSFDGDVVRSQDGGASWSPAPGLPAGPHWFRDVSMWDDDRGILLGGARDGYHPLLVTDDGGDTWTEPSFDPVSQRIALSVYCVGENTAYVGGNPSIVYKTTDGGTTWTAYDTKLPFSLPQVMFADELNGWALTQRNRYGRTTDGGLTWTESDPSGVNPYQLHFADPLNGIGVNTGGLVHTTTDGGDTWVPSHIGWSGWSHVRSVWMESATDAVIVGTETKIMVTRSGGHPPR